MDIPENLGKDHWELLALQCRWFLKELFPLSISNLLSILAYQWLIHLVCECRHFRFRYSVLFRRKALPICRWLFICIFSYNLSPRSSTTYCSLHIIFCVPIALQHYPSNWVFLYLSNALSSKYFSSRLYFQLENLDFFFTFSFQSVV